MVNFANVAATTLAVAAIANGCGNTPGLNTDSNTRQQSGTMPMLPAAPRVARKVRVAPSFIPADCSVDVTEPLLAWLNRVPNGSRLLFPRRACYEIEGTLELRNRSNLVIEGNGAILRSWADATDQRAIWRLVDSRSVVLRDMTVRGSYSRGGSFDPDLQHAHAIDLRGTSAEVAHVTLADLAGDCVYFGLGFSAAKQPSSGHVHDVQCVRTSRNAISVTAGEDVLVDRVVTSRIGLTAFDIEPNPGPGWGAKRVAIRNNWIGSYGLYAYAVLGDASISDQFFIGNRAVGNQGLKIAISDAVPADSVLISGNVPTPTANR